MHSHLGGSVEAIECTALHSPSISYLSFIFKIFILSMVHPVFRGTSASQLLLPRLRIRHGRGDGKTVSDGGCGWRCKVAFFYSKMKRLLHPWTQQLWLHVCAKPAQDKASPHPACKGGAHKDPLLASELLVIDDCLGRESLCSLDTAPDRPPTIQWMTLHQYAYW